MSTTQYPYQVPYAYMLPLFCPKRTQYTDEREYEQAVAQYQTELDKRWSCFRPTVPRPVSEHVGGEGTRMSMPRPRPVSEHVGGRRRLDLSSDTDTDDEVEDDDVVMDVGGRGRLEYRSETGEEDVESYLTLEGGDGDFEDDSDYDVAGVFEEESPMYVLTYSFKAVTQVELEEQMSDTCCFCLEEFKRADAVTTDCKHSFCTTCYERFRSCPRATVHQKRTCPCCRKWVTKLMTYRDKETKKK